LLPVLSASKKNKVAKRIEQAIFLKGSFEMFDEPKRNDGFNDHGPSDDENRDTPNSYTDTDISDDSIQE